MAMARILVAAAPLYGHFAPRRAVGAFLAGLCRLSSGPRARGPRLRSARGPSPSPCPASARPRSARGCRRTAVRRGGSAAGRRGPLSGDGSSAPLRSSSGQTLAELGVPDGPVPFFLEWPSSVTAPPLLHTIRQKILGRHWTAVGRVLSNRFVSGCGPRRLTLLLRSVGSAAGRWTSQNG